MKKIILFLGIVMLPCLALAQSDGPIIDDSYHSVYGIAASVKLNDHLGVFEVRTKKDKFDLLAVNDNFQVVWKITIDGDGIAAGRFKNKLLIVTATAHSKGSAYKAILIDPATGNKLTEKIIYDYNKGYFIEPQVIISDDYFKFVMRERDMQTSFFSLKKNYNETRSVEVIDLNEKLDSVNTVNAVISGKFINIKCNKKGDTFIAWLNGPDIEVYKYPAGKTAPVRQLTADIAIEPHNINLGKLIYFQPSPSQPDNLYYTLLYRNENNDTEMILGKMDFANGTKQAVTKVFLHDDMKALKKSFVAVNSKIKDVDLENPKTFELKSLCVDENVIAVSVRSSEVIVGSYSSGSIGHSVLYNFYDADLNPKFQQIFPASFEGIGVPVFAESNHFEKNKLYVLGNLYTGRISSEHTGLYAMLNLTNGQWEKIETIKDKPVHGYLDSENIIWLDKGFIAPYMKNGSSSSFSSMKYEMLIQGNLY